MVLTGRRGKGTILLAEDSDFFRSQLKRFLEGDGYSVLDAADGELAWGLLQQNLEKVQLLVTDVEMPNLTGLDLTRRIRSDSPGRQAADHRRDLFGFR